MQIHEIKYRLRASGITVKTLADACGLPHSTVNASLNGYLRLKPAVEIKALELIAEVLNKRSSGSKPEGTIEETGPKVHLESRKC